MAVMPGYPTIYQRCILDSVNRSALAGYAGGTTREYGKNIG
mgnify:CR=1 FL=1